MTDFNMQELQARIEEWAKSKLPNRTLNNDIQKLVAEQAELLVTWYERGYVDPRECADIAIVLFCICNLAEIDLFTAIIEKLEILEGREYAYDTEKGIWQRTEDAGSKETEFKQIILGEFPDQPGATEVGLLTLDSSTGQEETKSYRCTHDGDQHKSEGIRSPRVWCRGCGNFCTTADCQFAQGSAHLFP